MPWMPEFFSAPIAEAQQAEEVARINDAVAYYEGILAEEPDALIRSFVEQPPPELPEPLRLKLFAQLEEGGLGRPSPPSSQGLSPRANARGRLPPEHSASRDPADDPSARPWCERRLRYGTRRTCPGKSRSQTCSSRLASNRRTYCLASPKSSSAMRDRVSPLRTVKSPPIYQVCTHWLELWNCSALKVGPTATLYCVTSCVRSCVPPAPPVTS